MSRTLRRGDRDPVALYELVGALHDRGYARGVPRPLVVFGVVLEREVKRFQAQHGIAVDGIVGPQTRALLVRSETDRDPRNPCDPSTSVGAFLAACLDHLDAGVREVPMGSNRVPELERRAQGQPWCSYWVHDRIRAVRKSWIFGGRRGSTKMDLRMASERGLLIEKPRPGDVWILCDADGIPYHTGVLLRRSAARMDTVEGNSANRVAIRRRPIAGCKFWRPFPGALRCKFGLLPDNIGAAPNATR